MQTFLPYADFDKSVQSLDMMRLGKQRVETFQILQKLIGERLTNTTKMIDTGRKRIKIHDPDGIYADVPLREINLDEVETYEEPILKKIDVPRAKWGRESIAGRGWTSHPAKVMWEGHSLALLEYQRATVREWVRRGYRDTCWVKSVFLLWPHREELLAQGQNCMPFWMDNEDFHRSHRSRLVQKRGDFYEERFPDARDEDYLWPHHRWPEGKVTD